MGKKHPLKIESIPMAGDGDELFFSRGHHDRSAFAAAVRQATIDWYNWRADIDDDNVEEQHWRGMPDQTGEFSCCWWRSRSAGHGAMPVTVWMDPAGPSLGYVDEMNG